MRSATAASPCETSHPTPAALCAANVASQARQDPPEPPTVPQINSGGTKVTGTARDSVDHPFGSNTYTVQFSHDVSGCAYSATLAAVQNGTTLEQPPAGRITVASAGGASVLVRTFDANGAAAPEPFHLLVSC